MYSSLAFMRYEKAGPRVVNFFNEWFSKCLKIIFSQMSNQLFNWKKQLKNIIIYQLPLILTALLHIA